MERDVRKETLEEVKSNLINYGRTSMIRTMGFGKTYQMVQLAVENKEYKKVLYVCPGNGIKTKVIEYYFDIVSETREEADKNKKDYFKNNNIKTVKTFKNIDFLTYAKISISDAKDYENLDYDLVCFDEAHQAGAKQRIPVIKNMLDNNSNTHFIFATGTPDRMDAFDIVDNFCNNINVSAYSMNDTFKNNFLIKPNYFYCAYGDPKKMIAEDLEREILKKSELLKPEEKRALRKEVIEHAKLWSMEKILKATCEETFEDISYLQFICYFSNVSHIKEKGKTVVKWFKEAFPNHKINTLRVTSLNEDKGNLEKANSLVKKENTIDLIFAINMLNEGFRTKDLSGIIMYRATESSTVFCQEYGRPLKKDKVSLVIDLVNNLNRGTKFDNFIRRDFVGVRTRHIEEAIANGTYCELKTVKDKDGNDITIGIDMRYDKETNNVVPLYSPLPKPQQTFEFNATGVEASYKEFIEKMVVLPIIHRCQMVLANYLNVWCYMNNFPFPISDRELVKEYKADLSDFQKWFFEIIEKNGLGIRFGNDYELLENDDLFKSTATKFGGLTAKQVVDFALRGKRVE